MARGLDQVYRGLRDGFLTGADILGVGWAYFSGDQRPIGYRADRYSFSSEVSVKRSLLEETAKAIGDVAGLSLNIATFGLVNVMTLGEVYCTDERAQINN